MARVSAYGDITITDLTDVGRITSYLNSSLPLTVLYNPNQTPSYNPNCGDNKPRINTYYLL